MKIKNDVYKTDHYDNLRDMMNKTTEKFSDKTAFIVKTKKEEKINYRNVTFKEFREDVDSLGTALISLGLKNARVVVISPNRYEWCVTYMAVVNGVGVIVPLDRSLPGNEMQGMLERSQADAIIFDKKYKETIRELKNNCETINIKNYICMDDEEDGEFLSYSKLLEKGREMIKEKSKNAETYLNAEIDIDKMSILLFTSGTTSLSKAVMLTHRNLIEQIPALRAILDAWPGDVSLSFLPLHHTFGSLGVWYIYVAGATTVFCDGLKHIQENLKEYGVTVLVTVPLLIENMYKKIMKTLEKEGKIDTVNKGRKIANGLEKLHINVRRKLFKDIIDALGGKLRIFVVGAAALDKEISKAFNEFGILVCQGYGLTETSPVVAAEPDKHIKYGSVGFPLRNLQVEINEPNEEGIGEIKVKGPSVMLGYYGMPEETANVLKDGWFYTGDLGYFDKQGYLYITGRKKDVIVLKNGKNIYPDEIESLINKLEYVSETLVFGYPKEDDLIVTAKIVYNKDYIEENYKDMTKEDLQNMIWTDIKQINSTVAGYQHVKKIIITNEPLIKTTTAKVKRFIEIKKTIDENK
ncbi:MAG: long-chain fatty acid--CoA ligase [Clostridia bacterium]|nr:long-chain fatty acid--CoA ligase [Clostridia bacterium]